VGDINLQPFTEGARQVGKSTVVIPIVIGGEGEFCSFM